MIAPHLIPIKSPPPFPLKLNIVHFARPLRWAPQFFLLGISVFLGSELVGKLRNSTLLREIAKLVSLRGLANLFWAFQPSWCPNLHGKLAVRVKNLRQTGSKFGLLAKAWRCSLFRRMRRVRSALCHSFLSAARYSFV